MVQKPIAKIKHGNRVLEAISTTHFFNDIARATNLDTKTLQTALAALVKNGYIVKDSRNQWVVCELEAPSNVQEYVTLTQGV